MASWLEPGFTTAAMADIFSARRKVEGLLQFEAGLAWAASGLGLVTVEVAREIESACLAVTLDPEEVLASTWTRGTPLLLLLETLRSELSAEAGAALHRGATSQDAIDTGLMLQVRDALALLNTEVSATKSQLQVLADRHQTTPVMARTLLQEARPTTFGARASHWHSLVLRVVTLLDEARSSLPVQLGGPIGEIEDGGDLVEALAVRLGLARSETSWHTDRGVVRAAVSTSVEVALAMDKIAYDLVLLAGFDEVAMKAGRSSSMEHKRNPIDSIRAVTAARACLAAASALNAPGGRELERGVGSWQVEWWAVPLAFSAAAAAVEGVNDSLGSLEVKASR